MADANLADLPMQSLMEEVIPFRDEKNRERLQELLQAEGIHTPADLLKTSKEALETKLQTHAAFNFIETADVLSLREAIGKNNSKNGAWSMVDQRGRGRRRRSRSRSRISRSRSRRGGRRGGGFCNNSRSRRNSRLRQRHRVQKDKPELWSACERNDAEAVQQMLAQGKDPEEVFEGWTPLMKAAEEGALECLRLLVDNKANIEAANRKGRTALSFAAAPSMRNDDRTPRPTPIQCLRLLLERGAEPRRKDEQGKTAKDRAVMAKRDDAIAVFEEFRC